MNAPNEIVTTRLINAPREKVWQAWTEQKHLEQWYGPDGFTLTTTEFDFREGGAWRFMFHGPDGRDYPNHIVFTEIVPIERIAHDHGDDQRIVFRTVVTLEERGDQTFLTMRGIFPTAEERERVAREVGAVEGAQQTIGKLAAYVEAL